MRVEGTEFPPLEIRDGTCVVDGFGIRIGVQRGHLVVADGTGRNRHRSVLARATTRIRHLVVVGHTGSISLEALRWLADLGIDYTHLDPDGRILATSGALGLDEPRLRRSQVLAASSDVGLELTRWLLTEKLSGQRRNLTIVPGAEAGTAGVEVAMSRLKEAGTLEAMRLAEADAAISYWGSLEAVPVRFARKDEAKVPEHWLRLGTRGSPLTGSPRRAANPANAILNYLYAILEAQSRIACMKVGLDPGLGILHRDQPSRSSMALDLMEVVRPDADAEMLHLLSHQLLRASDCRETRQGDCRVLAPLTHQLSRYSTFFAERVGPVAEGAAQMLMQRSGRCRRLPTHLSQANRSRGRDKLRRSSRPRARREAPSPIRACPICGVVLQPGRDYCDQCLAVRRREILNELAGAGPAALARLRAEGNAPTDRAEVRRKIGAANDERRREAVVWEANNPGPWEPEGYRQEILPGLAGVTLNTIMKATGLSKRHASRIRRGEYVPHPRHWSALRTLAGPG